MIIADLYKLAEEHRARYNKWCENIILIHGDAKDYWMGRRDEAGYFRDNLEKIINQNDIELSQERLDKLPTGKYNAVCF